ncbi:hypothetical protein SO802_029436 [Lithocarpus litseifolius]|uniref:PB1-like domain-containing protein n=1 Tax=Lithocarpus litseifolius TaxID=425828 RepID=A0AAW2BVB6_9ROSI
MDDIDLKFKVHYGHTFLWNPNLQYFGGKVEIVYDKDPDRLNYFEVEEPHGAVAAIEKEFDWLNESFEGEGFDDDDAFGVLSPPYSVPPELNTVPLDPNNDPP